VFRVDIGVQGGFCGAVNCDLRGRAWMVCMQYTDLSGACNMDHLWTVKEALIDFFSLLVVVEHKSAINCIGSRKPLRWQMKLGAHRYHHALVLFSQAFGEYCG
jgi:hypothetical protein